MSDTAAHDPGHHQSEPREFTNPLVWTLGLVAMSGFLVWLFFHCMSVGAAEVRGEERVDVGIQAAGPPVDLPSLVHDTSPDFIAKGKAVFEGNCQNCHGANGDAKGSTTPNARNFRADAFKNPNGGGPYALYLVVTNGFNGVMPGFVSLHADLRMAAVQYIREAFVKKSNPKNYLEADPPELEKTIPPPGAESAGPSIPPKERPIPDTVPALLEDAAERAESAVGRLDAWADALPGACSAEGRPDGELLDHLVHDSRGLGERLWEDAKSGDQKGFDALLTGAQLPGSQTAAFCVMPSERLDALYAAARNAAGGTP